MDTLVSREKICGSEKLSFFICILSGFVYFEITRVKTDRFYSRFEVILLAADFLALELAAFYAFVLCLCSIKSFREKNSGGWVFGFFETSFLIWALN
jgi:hypothetical protein